MENPKLQKLDYAPPPPRSRKLTRRVLVGFVLLCVAVPLVKIVPSEWMRLQCFYYQSQCMGYQAGPDQIAFPTSGDSGLVLHEWDVFYSLLSPPGGVSNCTLFLHDRISPSGNRRLVVVDGNIGSAGPTVPDIGLAKYLGNATVRVIDPGTAWNFPREIMPFSGHSAQSYVCRLSGNVFYMGQIDPANPSHFTIRIVSSQTQRIVDGWLQDDDRVLLEPRFPEALPTTQPN